jgi:transposase
MPKKLKVSGPATEAEVVAARKGSQDQYERERLQAIRLAMTGRWTMAEIGEAVGRARSTIGQWIKAFRDEGREGLLRRGHGGGGGRRLSETDLEALKEGLAAGRWKTAKQIQRWLDQERGVKLTVGGVY